MKNFVKTVVSAIMSLIILCLLSGCSPDSDSDEKNVLREINDDGVWIARASMLTCTSYCDTLQEALNELAQAGIIALAATTGTIIPEGPVPAVFMCGASNYFFNFAAINEVDVAKVPPGWFSVTFEHKLIEITAGCVSDGSAGVWMSKVAQQDCDIFCEPLADAVAEVQSYSATVLDSNTGEDTRHAGAPGFPCPRIMNLVQVPYTDVFKFPRFLWEVTSIEIFDTTVACP